MPSTLHILLCNPFGCICGGFLFLCGCSLCSSFAPGECEAGPAGCKPNALLQADSPILRQPAAASRAIFHNIHPRTTPITVWRRSAQLAQVTEVKSKPCMRRP